MPWERISPERVSTRSGTPCGAGHLTKGVQKIAKSAFPASEVYGNVGFPSVRLVTCGGLFDTTTRQYLDNVVVYAHLITSAR